MRGGRAARLPLLQRARDLRRARASCAIIRQRAPSRSIVMKPNRLVATMPAITVPGAGTTPAGSGNRQRRVDPVAAVAGHELARLRRAKAHDLEQVDVTRLERLDVGRKQHGRLQARETRIAARRCPETARRAARIRREREHRVVMHEECVRPPRGERERLLDCARYRTCIASAAGSGATPTSEESNTIN
jgi:hypothetical protein